MIDEEITDFVEEEADNADLFDCEYSPVDAVVNKITVFTGVTTRSTENGDRTLVAFGEGAEKSAFFTDSKKLKNVFCAPSRHYPFRAVVKVVPYGIMFGFKVFAPNTEITQADIENFEFYKRTKTRRPNR